MRYEERALRFALNALEPSERAALEEQRKSDDALDAELDQAEALVSTLALAKEEADVPLDLWSRIGDAIGARSAIDPEIETELLEDGKWRKVRPRVEMKRIWGGAAHLVRCEAGAVIKEHDHPSEERMMIVSGSVHIGRLVLGPGDSQISPAGSKHPDISTPNGCVFLLQSMDEAA